VHTKTSSKNKIKNDSVPSTTIAQLNEIQAGDIFLARPDRTIEWLGGVNHENFHHVFSNIKNLMLNDKDDEIHLVVNSYGGATGIGMSFYDSMTSWLRPNLVTIGSGDVDSSGIIVFLSGKKRYLTRNTTLLFHLAGRTFESGKRFSTSDMDSMLREDKLKDYQYACVVAERTNGKFCPDKILELMSRNTIITAEEAVNMGLAHRVI
jgi:ATP-dependent Clp protease protease subunit